MTVSTFVGHMGYAEVIPATTELDPELMSAPSECRAEPFSEDTWRRRQERSVMGFGVHRRWVARSSDVLELDEQGLVRIPTSVDPLELVAKAHDNSPALK